MRTLISIFILLASSTLLVTGDILDIGFRRLNSANRLTTTIENYQLEQIQNGLFSEMFLVIKSPLLWEGGKTICIANGLIATSTDRILRQYYNDTIVSYYRLSELFIELLKKQEVPQYQELFNRMINTEHMFFYHESIMDIQAIKVKDFENMCQSPLKSDSFAQLKSFTFGYLSNDRPSTIYGGKFVFIFKNDKPVTYKTYPVEISNTIKSLLNGEKLIDDQRIYKFASRYRPSKLSSSFLSKPEEVLSNTLSMHRNIKASGQGHSSSNNEHVSTELRLGPPGLY